MDFGAILTEYILPHWPFFGAMVMFMIVGQFMTKQVFTKTAHYDKKPVWFWWWGRKTLPLHPIVAGLGLGFLWNNPEPGSVEGAASMAYFATSGALSIWLYEMLKGIAKSRGIDLSLPGVDDARNSKS